MGRPRYPQWTIKGHWKESAFTTDYVTLTYRRTNTLEGDRSIRNLIADAQTAHIAVPVDHFYVPVRVEDPLSVALFVRTLVEVDEEIGPVPQLTPEDRDRYAMMDYQLVKGKWRFTEVGDRSSKG